MKTQRDYHYKSRLTNEKHESRSRLKALNNSISRSPIKLNPTIESKSSLDRYKQSSKPPGWKRTTILPELLMKSKNLKHGLEVSDS